MSCDYTFYYFSNYVSIKVVDNHIFIKNEKFQTSICHFRYSRKELGLLNSLIIEMSAFLVINNTGFLIDRFH